MYQQSNDEAPQLRSDLTDKEREAADAGAAEAFRLAFGGASNESTQVASAPAPAPSPSAAPAPAEARQVDAAKDDKSGTAADDTDPFKDLHPKVRDMLAEVPSLKRNYDALHNRLAPVQQKLSAVERENAELRRQLDERTTAPASKASPEDAATDELRQRVAGELPEVTDLITAEIQRALRGIDPVASMFALQQVKTERIETRDDGPSQEAQSLAKVHPDWVPVMQSSDYKLWVASQPREFEQEVMSTNDPVIVADSLTKFKAHTQRAAERVTEARDAEARRQNRTQRGLTPGGRTAPPGGQAMTEQDAMLAAFRHR